MTTELNGASLFSLIERDLQRVRAALREVSQDFQESTRTLLEHAGADRGKLLRPALLLLSGTAFGVVTPDHVRAATVLELIHNATLLHDDVLDLVGDRRVLRKTLGTDLRSTKLTLPLIHALCVAGEPARALLQCKLRARSLARGELLPVLAAGESVDYVLARIRRYERRAAAALRDVRVTPGKAALLAVPCSIWHEAVEGSRDHRGLSRPRPAARGAPRPAGGRA